GEKISQHRANVYLVNTGWTGGPYGIGRRMDLTHTRRMVSAATSGQLEDVDTKLHDIFNLEVPVECPGVPADVLDPRSTWSDKAAYDKQARELAEMFVKNFERFARDVSDDVVKAGPIVG
ncbi:MAG TPA: phosphoenolpyruvate carboxykinase (ATP), partial [Actinomycetota bacterium]|nr:phosphoenolpyruvate carboxykinase (ATP) [Actinomycetota bacterium]